MEAIVFVLVGVVFHESSRKHHDILTFLILINIDLSEILVIQSLHVLYIALLLSSCIIAHLVAPM